MTTLLPHALQQAIRSEPGSRKNELIDKFLFGLAVIRVSASTRFKQRVWIQAQNTKSLIHHVRIRWAACVTELPDTVLSEETSGILGRILEEFELTNSCPPLKSSSSSSSLLGLGSPCLSTKLTRAHNLWGAWV
jgi:hypothetical protein